MTAEGAYRIGLINRVVKPGKERGEAWLSPQDRQQISHIVRIGKQGFIGKRK